MTMLTALSSPTTTSGVRRQRLVVRGIVQGVGFRPHVGRLALELGLGGSCRNDATSVVIEVEGPAVRVDEFTRRLQSEAPPMSRILDVATRSLAASGQTGFEITRSTQQPGPRTLVPADTAVCADCLRELFDPADRRFRHPFVTCTNCGPRLTITVDLPYDRPSTTMAGFGLCAACEREYLDPHDRRHHAQPIACHDCGPELMATDRHGRELAAGTETSLHVAVSALRAGAIVAIKGLGGYHLACDAASEQAVRTLRERKHRPDQPFAVMAADLTVARELADVGAAAAVLTSPERPIVLLPRRSDAALADAVAPGIDEVGLLLPYTPIQHLLFADLPGGEPGAPLALVMTSGNLSGEALCYDDEDAVERLGGIADVFLTHNRAIAVPCEDSVLAWDGEQAIPIRRSRGFAPLPVVLDHSSAAVLAAGAELKNTVALARDGLAFVSAHVGDLGTLASREAQGRAAAQLVRFHRRSPDLVVTDLHPGYASRAWGRAIADDLGVPTYEVQHHHAHLAALAAEHGRLDEPILGLVYDGTGYGCDASVWGGELLLLSDGGLAAERVGHLGTVRLPSGDAGIRNPALTAALALLGAGLDPAGTPAGAALSAEELRFVRRMHESGLGWVPTSSVGRLFDVVAAVLGVRARVSYEAQAALELEAAARLGGAAAFELADLPILPGVPDAEGRVGPARLDPEPMLRDLVAGLERGVAVPELALAFHRSLASSSAALAGSVARARGLSTIGLSGGVFCNRLLRRRLARRLIDEGFDVLTHRMVPANDGGLALGQVALGARFLARARGQEG